MQARARLSVAAGPPGRPARITRLEGAAPVGWRPAPDAVYMIGTAASPVGADRVDVEVDVGAGAALSVRSTAATIAWSGSGTRHRTRVRVAAGALLDWSPEPLLLTGRCDHAMTAEVELASGAALWWTERVVLGRDGEQPGRLRTHLSVDAAGRPLLRHGMAVGAGAAGWDSPAVLGAARVCGLVLAAGEAAPATGSPLAGAGDGWALLPLEGPGWLGLALGSTVTEVDRSLGRLRQALASGGVRP